MDEPQDITDDERVNRLVVHLAEIVQAGGKVEQQTTFGAVVLRRTKAGIASNLFMVLAGLALFALTMEPLFALAALVSSVGWTQKVLHAANPRRLWIRVDEMGHIRETELETA